eukprot:IDg18123t1
MPCRSNIRLPDVDICEDHDRLDADGKQFFFQAAEESPFTEKLMQWGQWNGIATFEDCFPNGMEPPLEPRGTQADIAFLRTIQDFIPYRCDDYSLIYRFLCVPKAPYGDAMPTATDIVRDLRNETHFTSSIGR